LKHKRCRIIVVDDSEICREIARIALEARGHAVTTLDSPLGLNRAIHELRPDLVLLDLMMPSLGGDKAASILQRQSRFPCPFVFLSDRPPAELEAVALTTGAAGYISKTNDLVDLADRVERYLKE
jgi:two-component system OmpR family response regulator